MKKARMLLVVVLLLELAYLVYSETNNIVVSVRRIEDDALAGALGPLRVVHLSDLHVKRFGIRESNLVKIMRELDPDIVFITGDFAYDNRRIAPCAALVRSILEHRRGIGVLGNNDQLSERDFLDTGRLLKELETAGLDVLVNESLRLTVRTPGGREHQVYVVGVNDNFSHSDNIFKAVANVPPGAPRILLAHAPNIVEKIDTADIRLILSGHTHGGQIVVPFFGAFSVNPPPHSRRRFVAGLYREETLVYVNRGIGTMLVPVRLFAKPEVTVLEFIRQGEKRES